MRWAFSFLILLSGCLPPEPGPNPGPGPEPGPNPGPVVDGCWPIVVEETAERTPERAEVLADLEFWTGLESLGVRFRFYDDDAPAAARFVRDAEQAGVRLPALVVVSPEGRTLRVDSFPKSTAAVRAIVTEVTGR